MSERLADFPRLLEIFLQPTPRIQEPQLLPSKKARGGTDRIGVLVGCFGRNIDGDSRFTWWCHHLPGPSIAPKRTPRPPERPRASPSSRA